MPPQLVVVTGMHRSGTSLLARVVDLLGVSLGPVGALLPPGDDNPAGYWENQRAQVLDDDVLHALGGSWDLPPWTPPGWAAGAEMAGFRDRAAAVADELLGGPGGDLRAVKDPRIALLLPLWRSVAPVAATLVAVRDPDEVAASLAVRNGTPAARAAYLWLRYTYAALRSDPGAVIVGFHECLADIDAVVHRLEDRLGLVADASMEAAVRAAVEGELAHHRDGTGRAAADDPLSQLARRVWDGGALDLDAPGDVVTEGFAEGWIGVPLAPEVGPALAEEVAGLRCQVDAYRDRNEELKGKLAAALAHRDEIRDKLDDARAAVARLRASHG